MSVQAIAWVLEHADAQGADRLVMIAIANHASATDDGDFEAYPSEELIAEEAGLDATKTVKKAIGRLVRNGQLYRKVNGAPDRRIAGNRRPNLYRILTRPRRYAEQLGERFKPETVATHPAFATGDRNRLPLPSAEPIPRGRRVASKDPAPPQLWVIHDRLYLRNGHPDEVDPDDELVAVSPPPGGSSEAPPGDHGDNHTPGGSSEDTPEIQGGPPETDRGVLSGRAGGSSEGAQGGPPRPPKPKHEPTHEPSLNPADAHRSSRADSRDPVDNARRRLHELLTRRADRPTATNGLRTGREAMAEAHAKARAAATGGPRG